MAMFFKCKHPAASLSVQRDETRNRVNADFEVVKYHLVCARCREQVDISYSRMIGGVDGFLSRTDKASSIST